ncbi:molybdenum cofactor biosynthesis protein A [Mycobacterium tuberculosis]|nr:molybdenum cofactor biosynthesis protein A [Mycobacterium tuberculosis]
MTLTALGMPALRSRTNGIADPRVVPTTGPLVDTFGRVANDLRVSLTDRCNLRCSYCMPERGLRWLPGEQLLRPDELARLIHTR